MTEWKYKIVSPLLREAVKVDTSFLTLGAIVTTVKRFNEHTESVNAFPKELKDDFLEFYSAVLFDFSEGEDELYNRVVIDEGLAPDIQQYVDFRLSEFYELCRRWEIWVVM